MGLHLAGHYVEGVDNAAQPKYPFSFNLGDALNFPLEGFDFVWASPVCKRYSSATKTSKTAHRHPDQIAAVRKKLSDWGGPYVIENVLGAPLINPVLLCGTMFDLKLYRHRIFESNFYIEQPVHPKHTARVCKMGRPPKRGEYINPVGHFSGVAKAREAMDIDWLGQKELAQAIPPRYSEYIINQYMNSLKRKESTIRRIENEKL